MLCLVYYCQPKAGSMFQRHLPTAANSSMTPERVTGLSGGLEGVMWTGKLAEACPSEPGSAGGGGIALLIWAP